MDGDGFEEAELDALEHVVRDTSAEPMNLSLQLLRHITNDFSPEYEIDTDEFAVVYLGVLPSGFRMAVKKFHLRGCLDDESAFNNDFSIAMKAAHKDEVRLIGYCHHTQEQIFEYEGKQVFAQVGRERLICTEYVPHGTVCGHIEGRIYIEMDGYEYRAELDALERVLRDESVEPMSLTLPLLRHITNNFSDESVIGSGGFSTVYLGVLPSGLHIAVKKIANKHTIDESAFQNEVFITMKVAHKNTLRFIGYCSHTEAKHFEVNGQHVFAEDRERLICVEYVPNGTLDTRVGEYGELDWNQRYQILKGICQGLCHLHETLHVVHGDIKPSNILIGDNHVPKFFDFGMSRSFDDGETSGYTKDVKGTIGYMAPEMIEGHWSTKSDIYSLGIMITELLTGKKGCGPSVEQVLKQLRKRLVKEGAFSSWENKYHQVRTCLEIGYTCMEDDPDKRPSALEIIQRLYENESANYSAPPLWQSGDEESDLSDTEASKTETTAEFLLSDEEPASADTTGETSTQEPDKPDLVIELPASVDLSDLKVLEKITDDFSHERIVGKDGTFRGSHKAFVYKGDVPRREMVAVKRLIGVAIPVEKFKREAEQFMSLDHKNIVKVAGYCHDQSRGHKLVRFRGDAPPQAIKGPEQLLSYEYMHNGSLRNYLIGQGSREIDWQKRYKLIKGICAGLHYLHKGRANCPIVHLNLSPSNVLLDENYIPRITGFDFSKLIGEKNTKSVVLKLNGPIAYLPPDFLHSKGPDLKYLATVDIYSLGLIILEIVTQQEIKGNHGVLIKSIEENWREESQITRLYTSLEADELQQVKMCIDIGLYCVQSKPEKRPTAEDIMLWLDKGIKPVPTPRAGGGVSRPTVSVPRAGPGVPRPPAPTNITHADDRIQGNEKPEGFIKRIFRRK
ncbi:receptor like protein kinase S.2 isoform X2 [Triticum aestivum]|uniref:receptor like protein kinase S.2 isoform X2 n=1 Tax=Triticum aestivum TaxID=4565 RepID=UPI001D00C383|nr:receptor like protein kinase S.2-like isoform X2 [Triticum aestivum]